MRAVGSGLVAAVSVALLAAVPAHGGRHLQPRLYLLSSSGRTLVAVSSPRTDMTPSEAVGMLIAGGHARTPRGRSAFPTGSSLSSVTISSGTATVNLHGRSLAALRTIPRLRVIASVTWTLTSFPIIKRTRFELDGRAWGVYNHRGRVIREYARGEWLTACAPSDGCFQP